MGEYLTICGSVERVGQTIHAHGILSEYIVLAIMNDSKKWRRKDGGTWEPNQLYDKYCSLFELINSNFIILITQTPTTNRCSSTQQHDET